MSAVKLFGALVAITFVGGAMQAGAQAASMTQLRESGGAGPADISERSAQPEAREQNPPPGGQRLPPIAGRWRVQWNYEKRVPGASGSATETWEIRREAGKFEMTRLGMMMLPEDMWRRDPVKLSNFQHNGRQISFTADGSRYTLTHDGDAMAGRFTASPGSALGGGTVKFVRTVSFEDDAAPTNLDPKTAALFKPAEGFWEVVLEYTETDPAFRQEQFGVDPNRARDHWEISLDGGLSIHRVDGTLLPPSMWTRRPLPITEVMAPEPPTLGFKTVEGETQTVYAVHFHSADQASGRFRFIDSSFFPHAKPIEAKGRLKLTKIPDFATHISEHGVSSLSDALRRQSALRERCERGDKQACEQLQREVSSFNAGIEFITGQLSEEVKRLEASNLRRKEFLARLWKDSAASAREAADQIDLESGKFKEGSQARLDREGESARLREYASEMDKGANELVGRK